MKLGYEREKSRKSKPGILTRLVVGIGQSVLAIALLALIVFKVPLLAPVKDTLIKIFEKMLEYYHLKGGWFVAGVVLVAVSVWFAINRERVDIHHREAIKQEIKKKMFSDLLEKQKGGK